MLEAAWKVVGVVTEARELKSEKNASWRGYVAKIATIGMTAEVQLNGEQFKQVGEGEHIEARGRFEERGGYLKLVCEKITKAPSAGKVGAA